MTIEIPAVPEEKERLKRLLPEMVGLGVTNLNLHQLRLTEFNAANLIRRNYTFIPAEKPIVMKSELAALEIIQYAKSHEINYHLMSISDDGRKIESSNVLGLNF